MHKRTNLYLHSHSSFFISSAWHCRYYLQLTLCTYVDVDIIWIALLPPFLRFGFIILHNNIGVIIIYFAKTFLRANPPLKNLDGKDFPGYCKKSATFHYFYYELLIDAKINVLMTFQSLRYRDRSPNMRSLWRRRRRSRWWRRLMRRRRKMPIGHHHKMLINHRKLMKRKELAKKKTPSRRRNTKGNE